MPMYPARRPVLGRTPTEGMTMAGGMRSSWQQLEHQVASTIASARDEAGLLLARTDCLRRALAQSEGLAVREILREFHDLELEGVIGGIVAILRECLLVMVATTGGGALIGGLGGAGVGALPGAALGAPAGAQLGEWILAFMGLKAIATYIVRDMPRIVRIYWQGIQEAWGAARPASLPRQAVHEDHAAIRRAAQILARGHVAMFVLLLIGIVAYLSKGRGSVGELAQSVRASKLGPKFSRWLVRNEGRLKNEPRLRVGTAPRPGKPLSPEDARPIPARRPRQAPPNKATPKVQEKPPFRGTVKYRSAKDANQELFDRGIADPAHPPFKAGTTVTDRTMMPGERINMLIDNDQLRLLQDPNGTRGLGGWGSPDTFASQSQGLQNMGITSGPGGFKPNGVQYQIQLEVQQPFHVLEGTAGPQGTLAGGGQQTFLDVSPQARRGVLKLVSVKPLPKP